MQKIEFKDYPDTSTLINAENLNTIQDNVEISINELDNKMNNQVAFGWYQTGVSPTFTFVSYDSTTYTGVVNSNLDLTPYLSVGMKVKFTQNSAIKYAFITAITSTQLTLFLGTDYSLNNSAISNSYYSMLKAPYGFPTNPDKWSILKISNSYTQVSNPVPNTVYQLEGISLPLPIGDWKISNEAVLFVERATAGGISFVVNLSESSNSTVNPICGLMCEGNFLTNLTIYGKNYIDSYIVNSPKTLYLTGYTPLYDISRFLLYGSRVSTRVKAICNYL